MTNDSVLILTICLMLTLFTNFTFSYKRDPDFSHPFIKQSLHCPSNLVTKVDRTKSMAPNFGSAIRRLKDTTPEQMTLQIPKFSSLTNQPITSDDLRQYEHLVMMKKNPYLDLNRYDMRYGAQYRKNARQSNSEHVNLVNDPADIGLNVEIFNRGLSGFAFPSLQLSTTKIMEDKIKINPYELHFKTEKDKNILRSLKDDVVMYGRKIKK